MVWTELSREKQDDIVLRSRTESLSLLANEYELLPQSLERKIRTLKQSGMFDYIVNKYGKNATKANVAPEKNVDNRSDRTTDPFLARLDRVVKSGITHSLGKTLIENVNPDAQVKDRLFYINPKKQWHGIFFTDLHCPYQDKLSIDAMIRVMKVLDHNIIINGGDNLDLYGLSTFAKDYDNLFVNNFDKEIAEHNIVMERIAAVTDAPKISLYGNHMERYDKWLSNTPFVSMNSARNNMSLDKLLSMSYYGWHNFAGTIMFAEKDNEMFPKPKLVLDHGTRVAKGAGKSAASQFKSYGAVSYIMGHVHRLGVSYMRTLHGQHCLAEGGTLRGLNPDYMKYPDWQNGMLHFVVDGDTVSITPILITNGHAYMGNTKI